MDWLDEPQNYMGLYGILQLVSAIMLCKCLFLKALEQCSTESLEA